MRQRVGALYKVMSFSRKYQTGPYIYCNVHMINYIDNHLDVVIYMYIYEYMYIYSYECIYCLIHMNVYTYSLFDLRILNSPDVLVGSLKL